ncbi:MAG: NtrZ family periplasmic regulatory protein [Hyphomonadaceae bacterium]
MFKPSVIAVAGAVLVTAGVAHAQDSTPAERAAVRAEVPWYEQFTYGQGPAETMTGLGPSDRIAQPAWSLSQHWGVTVDVRQAERVESPSLQGRDEAAVGAYFQFTPRMRVGGQVSLRDRPSAAAPGRSDDSQSTGVRLESAFRF